MNTPTNPVLHVPAHKQADPAAKPGQIVNRIDGCMPSITASLGQITEPLNSAQVELDRQVSDPMYRHSTVTGRFTTAASHIEEVSRNVCRRGGPRARNSR